MSKGFNINNHLLWVHGASGAGKGVAIDQLIREFQEKGIKVRYISSGDLFRKLKSRPEIQARMQQGEMFKKLDDILPELSTEINDFLNSLESGEREFVIFDGLLRNCTEVVNGEVVPSQQNHLQAYINEVIESRYSHDTPDMIAVLDIASNEHLVIDADSKDAAAQIEGRAHRSLQATFFKFLNLIGVPGFNQEIIPPALDLFELVYRQLSPETSAELSLTNFDELKAQQNDILSHLKEIAGLNGASSIVAALNYLVEIYELRDDDLDAESRRNRVEAFGCIRDGKLVLGQIGRALIEGIRVKFDEITGEITSTESNVSVLRNGPNRGVLTLTDYISEVKSFTQRFVPLMAMRIDAELNPSRSVEIA